MNWDDLRYLLALSEHGSLSAAGRHLRVDQATVGRRLAALQRAVGIPLVERSSQGMRLTAAGEQAVLTARRIEDTTAALARQLAEAEPRVAGTVRVTAPDTVASQLLAPNLALLRERHPELQVELLASSRAVNLARQEADVAVRLFRPLEPTLAVRRLGTLAFALYASPDYVRRRGRPRLDALREHVLVTDDASVPGTAEKQWLEEVGQGASVALRSNTRYALLTAARAGVGLALLPCYLGDTEPGLLRVCPPEKVPPREAWLVVHQDLQRVPRVRAVIDFLGEVFTREVPRLRGDKPAVGTRRKRR
ncbi:LysR family transcriptional regulator [Hyalangium rubrum]|uniref:LysR family transcriptional regulator n=1 Tax=Hyalangium rubrum TaxID=3103134 RepID=A0ABU5H130_9BACT|nr:LysR family transcriptional regulator [Hyalangium sp. s54d21]MDY7227163.1 LysR family transcriptional regulator [Hyalangium sp. s54d21]